LPALEPLPYFAESGRESSDEADEAEHHCDLQAAPTKAAAIEAAWKRPGLDEFGRHSVALDQF
jgi:hypothetical protein